MVEWEEEKDRVGTKEGNPGEGERWQGRSQEGRGESRLF